MKSLLIALFDPKVLIWIAQFLYTICLVPQIVVNYKLKSGKGLGDLFLLAYLNMSIPLLFYAFCVGLPTAYKLFYPLQSILVTVLIMQRLLYDNLSDAKIYWFIYMINFIVPIILIPYSIEHSAIVGEITGWTFFIISIVSQLPLVVKIAVTKSVRGVSFLFLLITGVAGVLEFYVALNLGLPIQTVLASSRVILFFIIFGIQFLLYKKSSDNA